MNNLSRPSRPRSHNRVAAVMTHTFKYAFKGRSRLAKDAGISRSALTRLMSGRTRPTHHLVGRVVTLLEREVGRQLDCREVISEDGTYPTTFVCDLVGCPGCLPAQVDSPKEHVRARYASIRPGQWTGDNQEGEADWQPIEEVR